MHLRISSKRGTLVQNCTQRGKDFRKTAEKIQKYLIFVRMYFTDSWVDFVL